MYKLNIGVGFSVLQLYYLPHNDKSFLIDIVNQHKIILSEKIIKYYINETDELYQDVMQTFFDSILYSDETHKCYKSIADKNITAKDEIIMFVKNNPMKILFSDEEEFEKYNLKGIRMVTPKQMIDRDKTPLLKYSFPVSNYYVGIDEDCDVYATWFGHLFEHEKSIEIQDKYIMSPKGVACLKKYYFPNIDKGSKVDIYCEVADDSAKRDICDMLANDFFDDWDISVYACRHMHDRYIQLNQIQISVGAGLDFLHLSGKTKKPCTLNITNYTTRLPLPEIVECIV